MIGLQRFGAALILLTIAQAADYRPIDYLAAPNVTAITAVCVDSKGFLYEVGTTSWPQFPTTPGPLSQFSGNRGFTDLSGDVFVRKLSPDGSTVVFSVLIGGSGDETSTGATLDAQGNIYVTGNTDSADFPVTGTPSRKPSREDPDAFVFVIDPTGKVLLYSKLLGGRGYDLARAIALTPDGRVVISGTTSSMDFPTTANAVQRSAAVSGSAFVVRLAGELVEYATYLGGTGGATGEDIAVDSAGDIYVAGFAGPFFPTLATSFAPQAPYGGFVSKLDRSTGQFVYSTYLPGVRPPDEGPFARLCLRVDANRHAYVAGPAAAGFPATPGAFQTDVASNPFVRFPAADAFVLELDATGSRLVFATLYGGAGNDHATGLALRGNAIAITGVTSSFFVPTNDNGLPVCSLASFYYGERYTTFIASFDHSGKLVTAVANGTCRDERPTALVAGPSGLLRAGTSSGLLQTFLENIDLSAVPPVQISVIADAASLQIGPYAPLEIVSIFGRGLGPVQGVVAVPVGGQYPKNLAGIEVYFCGIRAPLLSVRGNQINAVVPQSIVQGWCSIWVATASVSSASLTTWMERATPALFTVDGSGFGQGAILNADGQLNSADRPAERGSTISLFATGTGVTGGTLADGQVPTAALQNSIGLAVLFGTTTLGTVTYAGVTPGSIHGLTQINVTIPGDAPTGPRVPITVLQYPFRSQSGVTVAIR